MAPIAVITIVFVLYLLWRETKMHQLHQKYEDRMSQLQGLQKVADEACANLAQFQKRYADLVTAMQDDSEFARVVVEKWEQVGGSGQYKFAHAYADLKEAYPQMEGWKIGKAIHDTVAQMRARA